MKNEMNKCGTSKNDKADDDNDESGSTAGGVVHLLLDSAAAYNRHCK